MGHHRAHLLRIFFLALDYGTLVVAGTGGTNEPFTSIANPLEFRRQVQARTRG